MKNLDYGRVKSMSDEEFSSYEIDIEKIRGSKEYTKTNIETLEKIERFLDGRSQFCSATDWFEISV